MTDSHYYAFILPYYGPREELGESWVVDPQKPFFQWDYTLVKLSTNCHMFAMNCFNPEAMYLPRGRYLIIVPKPGGCAGQPFKSYTLDDFHQAVLNDGCIPVSRDPVHEVNIPDGHHLISVYLEPATTLFSPHFHYFRHHKGKIYHKPGWDEGVTNLDADGREILNLQQANRGRYDLYVGTYLLPQGGYKGRVEIIRLPGMRERISQKVIAYAKKLQPYWRGVRGAFNPVNLLPRALRPPVSEATRRSGNSARRQLASGEYPPGF